MSSVQYLRGGSSGSYTPYSDYDGVVITDSISWPVGNINLAGSRVVGVEGLSIAGGYGIAGWNVGNAYVQIIAGTARIGFQRNPAAGGTITPSSGSGWAGGMCGYFVWATVALPPGSINAVRSGSSIAVTIAASASDGGNAITGYRVQYTTDNGATWSAPVAITPGVPLNFPGLPTVKTYKFRAYTLNGYGSSQAVQSAGIFVPASGKKKVGGVWQELSIAKVKKAGVWTDITIARKKVAGAWVDMG